MAYHEITLMDVWEVLRRWHAGSGIRAIARDLHYDRKTVQRYIRLAVSLGVSREKDLPPKDDTLNRLRASECSRGRSAHAQGILEPYRTIITTLVNDPDHSLKPKNAFRFLIAEYDLEDKVSYTTFKRFVQRHNLSTPRKRSTCRIEVPPGSEVQVDYAHVGKRYDPVEGHIRKLYAFIGTLSHSRLKYVELTFRQDQKSFVASHVLMFHFFGGVPSRIIIDNLKSGIISPDLYDPTLNHAYREMAEYYGIFIDPARVRTPQDKGKVERDVQTVREAVHLLIHLHPGALIGELNRRMLDWSVKEYGMREHGTTREKPFEVFTLRERTALKALPQDPFEMVEWKQATVHP
ncbi:MAG: IS21 family transposase, partial [Deltaproteobacteria bacterium]